MAATGRGRPGRDLGGGLGVRCDGVGSAMVEPLDELDWGPELQLGRRGRRMSSSC